MAAANKKLDQMVSEMDRLREQHRATPEYTLLHKLAELTGQLAESERRIEILKAEKNQVNSEKEQFRSNVHKLVSWPPCRFLAKVPLNILFTDSLLCLAGKSTSAGAKEGCYKERIQQSASSP
jgi:hypothetical protein